MMIGFKLLGLLVVCFLINYIHFSSYSLNILFKGVYPSGQWFTAYYYGSTRIQQLKNNADTDWRVQCTLFVDPNRTDLRSPLPRGLPIITVYSFVLGMSYSVISDDTQPLVYRLSTAAELGATSAIQPPGISVSSTGVVSFPNSSLSTGLWSTQQIVTNTDNISVSLDYIIQAVNSSSYCVGGTCLGGPKCLLDSECSSCNATTETNATAKCLPAQPRIITNSPSSGETPYTNFPTPTRGQLLLYRPNDTVHLSFVADDPVFGNNSLFLYYATLPVGAVMSPQMPCTEENGCECVGCNNPQMMLFDWNTTEKDMGTKSFCIGVRSMDNDLPYGQHCISIKISCKFLFSTSLYLY